MTHDPQPAAVADVRDLTVRYGRFTALDHLSVRIPEGCVGLLGPNGAGKTTLLKTLLGFLSPSSGRAEVLGYDARAQGREIRQRIGLMPEQDCHLPGMPAVQFVAYAGELAGMPEAEALRRAHEVLEYTGLGEARYRNIETYSTGMRQRIKLAQALVHGPTLLLLDEPTNGLDPRGREEMLDLIRDITHTKDLNVIVSSHLLRDIERTCDDVVVMFNGRLCMQGPIKELRKIDGAPVDVELDEANPGWIAHAQREGLEWLSAEGPRYRIRADLPMTEISRRVFRSAKESGAQVRGIRLATRSLEEAFLEALK